MIQSTDTKEVKAAIWFSSILRWVLGALFITLGVIYIPEDASAWILLAFGVLMFVTGFMRPKRCIDGGCSR